MSNRGWSVFKSVRDSLIKNGVLEKNIPELFRCSEINQVGNSIGVTVVESHLGLSNGVPYFEFQI
jgi:hypothetical protein